MTPGKGRSLWLLAVLAASCASAPRDPYERAERAVMQGDLLTALTLYDAVPPGHPRYPQARTSAQAVERRMRKSQELILEGLLLRTEWRDEEAIQAFERARRIWPTVFGVDELIAATRGRLSSLDLAERAPAVEKPANAEPWVISTEPVDPESPAGGDPTPLAETKDPAPADPSVPEALTSGRGDEVGRRLAEVEVRLARGNWESALAELESLASQFPEDARLKHRLARLLHQRALLRYGQGFLEAALADWHRVQQLDPDAPQVVQFMAAARAELEMRRRR